MFCCLCVHARSLHTELIRMRTHGVPYKLMIKHMGGHKGMGVVALEDIPLGVAIAECKQASHTHTHTDTHTQRHTQHTQRTAHDAWCMAEKALPSLRKLTGLWPVRLAQSAPSSWVNKWHGV